VKPTQQQFGRLTVLREAPPRGRLRRWICVCQCGGQTEVYQGDLRRGKVRSCGCLRVEVSTKLATKHGMAGSRLHVVWKGMIARCDNPKNKGYPCYGGRGIKVCAR